MSVFVFDPDRVSRDRLDLSERYGLFINGAFEEKYGEPFSVINPATGEKLTTGTSANHTGIDKAVAAARTAYDGRWGKLTGSERAQHLYQLAREFDANKEELALAESLDCGKPISQTLATDAPRSAEAVFSYAGWADKLSYVGLDAGPAPVGVVAILLSADCALLSLSTRVAPALAAGNTVVIHPSLNASLTALFFADIAREAGIPPGVVNVATGGSDVARALTEHRGVDGVVVPYSARCSTAILETVSARNARVAMPQRSLRSHVVFDDAPIDQAINGIVNDLMMRPGHMLCSGHVVHVQENIYNDVLVRLQRRIRTLQFGDPLDRNCDIGSFTSERHLDAYAECVRSALADGAREWTGEFTTPSSGTWGVPTVLYDVPHHSPVLRESICAPLFAVTTFRTPSEAAVQVNAGGRATRVCVWSDKEGRGRAFAGSVDATMVSVNEVRLENPANEPDLMVTAGHDRTRAQHGFSPYLRIGERT